VNHTVTSRHNAMSGQLRAASTPEKELDRTVVTEISAGISLLSTTFPEAFSTCETRMGREFFDVAGKQRLRLFRIKENRKLQARRAGFQD
jgi:hypothetical protein